MPLPVYILADEKHSRCLTDKVYLPTIVSGRVIWHLGYSDSKSAAAFTQSYGEFQQAALEQEPSYRVKGALTDGFDSTVSSLRTLFPGARLGFCLRHALNKLPNKLVGVSASVRQGLRAKFHALLHRCRQRTSLRVVAMGQCLRHAINKLPGKLTAIPSAVRKTLRSQFHTLLYRARQRKGLRVFALGQPMARGCGAGCRRRRRGGMRCSPTRRCPR